MATTRRQFFKQTAATLSSGLCNRLSAVDRPNFLVLLTDDQRADTFTPQFMPSTALLFADGVRFDRGFVTTPLCAPCRSSLLTGKYGHHTEVLDNQTLLEETTFVDRLHEAGYYTGLVGKYLNPWPGDARPEFDYWVAHPGGGSRYFDPRLNVNGEFKVFQGYITHLLRDFALQFLEGVPSHQPFLLYFAPNAPHAPFHFAPGYEDLYANLPPHRPPSFNEADVSDKPRWVQRLAPMGPDEIEAVELRRRQQLQMIRPVDDAVKALIGKLTQRAMLENTFIFFMGDNGFFWGEHRVRMGKNRVYEESQRVPYAVRYPRLISRPRVETRLVANIDLAPTIYELAGIGHPGEVDGLSLVPLLAGSNAWRGDLLFEGVPAPPFEAVRTEQFVYVENEGQRPELYDLTIDPFQLNNVLDPDGVPPPKYAAVLDDMQNRLARLTA